jgi:hypothetical protein
MRATACPQAEPGRAEVVFEVRKWKWFSHIGEGLFQKYRLASIASKRCRCHDSKRFSTVANPLASIGRTAHFIESIKNILHLANNRCNQQEERPAAEENRRRDDQARPLPRDAQPDYYRTSKNLTGNGLTWVPRS